MGNRVKARNQTASSVRQSVTIPGPIDVAYERFVAETDSDAKNDAGKDSDSRDFRKRSDCRKFDSLISRGRFGNICSIALPNEKSPLPIFTGYRFGLPRRLTVILRATCPRRFWRKACICSGRPSSGGLRLQSGLKFVVQVNFCFASSRASCLLVMAPSSCASSISCKTFPNAGPGL